MRRQILMAASLMGILAMTPGAQANDFPTLDRVDSVLTCMKENGGQTIDNLQRCSCQIDIMAQTVNFEEYTEARTYEVYKQMPGEKGSLFRETDRAKELTKRITDARADARKRCFVGAVRQIELPAKIPGKKIVAPQ